MARLMTLALLATAVSLCNAHKTPSGLTIDILKPVTCDRPTRNDDVLYVHYRGTLLDGLEFDSSFTRGNPIKFQIGHGKVIRGWEEGLLDMCVGEERNLTIPSKLAYGDRAVGEIPAGSTLRFETKLMGVEPAERTIEDDTTQPHTSPTDRPAECQLLGPFALVVQCALGLLALLSLVFKRWREHPRRPLPVWFCDVSKQVVGTAMLHVFNIAMSMLSSQPNGVDVARKAALVAQSAQYSKPAPNPCSFYLLNLAIDTTIGIPVLVIFLRVIHAICLRTPLASPPESIKSGNYGTPLHTSWWIKQCIIYFLGLFGMKLFVVFLFAALPWLAYVGDWALRWTEGNESLQIAFVMFIFPLAMNGLQYYIIDGFIKDKAQEEEGYAGVNQEESRVESTDELGRPVDDDDDDEAVKDGETSADLLKHNRVVE